MSFSALCISKFIKEIVQQKGMSSRQNHGVEETAFSLSALQLILADPFLFQVPHPCLSSVSLLFILDVPGRNFPNRTGQHNSQKDPPSLCSANAGEKVKAEVEELCISKGSGSLKQSFKKKI